MTAHLKYLSYVLRHKWHVFYAGRVLGVSLWQLLIHDLSKFSAAEWGPYVRRFYSGRGSLYDKSADPAEFHAAWKHHYTNNPHHPEYWTRKNPLIAALLYGAASGEALLPMPPQYVAEHAADLYGAGMAQGKPDIIAWYNEHGKKNELHPTSRALLHKHLLTLMLYKLIPETPIAFIIPNDQGS